MKRNLTKLAKELAAELLAGDRAGSTGTTIIAYYEPRNGTPRRVVRVIENAGDPYKATEQAAHQMPTGADAVLLTCAGWAAPTDDDETPTAPSLHPKRKRCALVVARTLTRKTPAIVSALALTGDDDIKTATDNTTGTGPLADAINQLADHLTTR
jgi:hypothetical protein